MKIVGRRQSHLFAAVIKTALAIIISLVILALQIAFYVVLILGIYNLWYLRIATEVIGILVVLNLYRRDINSSYKLSWTIFILALPFAGVVFYFTFGGGRNVPRRKAEKINGYLRTKAVESDCFVGLNSADTRGAMLVNSVHNNSFYDVYRHSETEFFPDIAEKHRRMLKDIEEAKEYVYIEYFIISDGKVLESVIDVLERKGKEGVKIKFIYDDIGSKKCLRRKTKKRIASIENLELCVYEPMSLVINPRINYRDHRKIAVVDGKTGYMGGDNLADEYTGDKIRFGRWRDNAVRITGDAVYALELMFSEIWYMSTGETLALRDFVSDGSVETPGYVLPFGDGPTNPLNPAYHLFESLTVAAEKYLYISTPYLIIDNSFINMIQLAAKSGVDVRILVPHIPDKKLIFAMTRGHYGDIIKAGGKIYEYTPGFNHAKNVIVDDKYAFIGTVNCDYRSMLLHFECGALLMHDPSVDKMRDDFLSAVEQSEEITLEKWENRPLLTKLSELLLSVIAPLL